MRNLVKKNLRPLFVIPARGGSKGIPDKNIALLGGRPLIAYAIDAAREALTSLAGNCAVSPELCSGNLPAYGNVPSSEAPDLSRIILSTDSGRIAEAAEREGIRVPFRRPAELSTDTAGSREVILHAMDWADKAGIGYDCVVLLQPTSPFRRARHILGAMELFNPENTDMVVSVCEASANPYYNCFETDSRTGFLHISKGDGLLIRRQDAPRAWEYNGAVYVINPQSLRQMPLGKFPRRTPYEMSREDSLDIDTPLDLEIARILLQQKSQGSQLSQSSQESQVSLAPHALPG